MAVKYGITDTTVSAIRKNRDKVGEQLDINAASPSRKSIYAAKYEDVDAALFQWFKELWAQNMLISWPVLQTKAMCFAIFCGAMNSTH